MACPKRGDDTQQPKKGDDLPPEPAELSRWDDEGGLVS